MDEVSEASSGVAPGENVAYRLKHEMHRRGVDGRCPGRRGQAFGALMHNFARPPNRISGTEKSMHFLMRESVLHWLDLGGKRTERLFFLKLLLSCARISALWVIFRRALQFARDYYGLLQHMSIF